MAETNREKLNRYLSILPVVAQDYLTTTATEKALSTRIEYAKDLYAFFEYLISFHPHFCIKTEPLNIELADLKILTPQDISRYLTIYKDNDHSERAAARKRASLSSFFTYLCNNMLLEFNPVAGATSVKIHTSDQVIYLNIEEQRKLLHCIETGAGFKGKSLSYQKKNQKRDFALVTLLLDTGMRVSELQQANIKDINLDDCYIIVKRKGGNIQTLYFSDEVSTYLDEYFISRKNEDTYDQDYPLFTSSEDHRLTVRAIEYMVHRYAEIALPGIGSKISPHKLRSSFAMEFYSIDNNVLLLQKKLGHKSLQATNIYVKATDKSMKESRNLMSDKRNYDI